jgi:hypothetical protein
MQILLIGFYLNKFFCCSVNFSGHKLFIFLTEAQKFIIYIYENFYYFEINHFESSYYNALRYWISGLIKKEYFL